MSEKQKKSVANQSKKSTKADTKEKTSSHVEEDKVTTKGDKNTKRNTIDVGSIVLTPSGKICKILFIEEEDMCHLERVDNQKKLVLNKSKLQLKK